MPTSLWLTCSRMAASTATLTAVNLVAEKQIAHWKRVQETAATKPFQAPVKTTPLVELGETAWRSNCSVMIPFFEWDEVKGDSKKEEEYVKRKLVEGEKSLTPK